MARTIEIIIKAEDHASPSFERAGSAMAGFGSNLGGMLAVAGGNLVASAISGMTRFFGSIAGGAMDAIGNAQNLEIALEGLLTQSLMYQQVNEQRSVAIGLTEQETARLADLQASLRTQNARMQEQREGIRQMSEEWGDAGLNVETARARLAEMELQFSQTEAEIGKLSAKENEFATVTETSYEKMMDFASAQNLAGEQAQDLLGYIAKLAVVSPFETSQVEQVAKIGLAAGLSTDKVKEFTAAFLDYAAVAGIPSASLDFAADQFLQLRKVGKLTEIDLRQLRRMGIDVARVLGVEMGMSVEEFNDQVEKSPELMDQLIDSFIKFSSETTAGAAQRMAMTVTGLKSSISDIVEIGSRNLFRPLVEAATPFASQLIGNIAGFVTGPEIGQIGQRMADKFLAGFQAILGKGQELAGAYQKGGLAGVGGVILEDLKAAWPRIESTLAGWGTHLWDWVRDIAVPAAASQLSLLAGEAQQWAVRAWPGIQAQLTRWGYQAWDWVRETAIPLASEKLNALATEVSGWVSAAWPGIRTQLADWGTHAWDWIQETAIPLAAEKLGAVATAIGEAWPGVKTQLTEWGMRFWDWIQETAIPLATEKLTLVGQSLADQWPAVSAKLSEWGPRFWDWIQDSALPLAEEKLGAVATKVGEAWPGIEAKLAEWGTQFWNWLTQEAIPQAGEKMDQLAAAIVAWSETPGAQEAGQSIGRAVVNGIQVAVDALVAGGYLTVLLMDAFKSMPAALAEATANLGSSIVDGIVGAIGEKLGINLADVFTSILNFLGVENARQWGENLANGLAEGFRAGLENTLSMMNPVAFLRNQVGNITEGIGGIQEAGGVGGFLSGLTGGLPSLSELLPFGAEDTTAVSTNIATGLQETLPAALNDAAVGESMLTGLTEQVKNAQGGQAALAKAFNRGVADHIPASIGVIGDAWLESVVNYVAGQLGITAEMRP